ncbi:hypothetical protein RB195_007824 [Necator americanus]|uniref:Secreted protein n=1 Tax=Necator americanus TaxID=51031 RepID=A0ABR1BZ72_NECAM
MWNPLVKLLGLTNLFQMANSCSVIDVEPLGNISCGFAWISFDCRLQQVAIKYWWTAAMWFVFETGVAGTKLLEPTLCCAFVDTSLAPYFVDISGLRFER